MSMAPTRESRARSAGFKAGHDAAREVAKATIATLTAERDELLEALTEMQRLDPYNQLEVAGEELAHLEAERDEAREDIKERDRTYLAVQKVWEVERDALRTALEAAAPEEGMVQDEQGGCVWCGRAPYPKGRAKKREDGLSVFDFPPLDEHDADCGWKLGREALGGNK